MNFPQLGAERARELPCAPETRVLTWRVSPSKKVGRGQSAGLLTANGYIKVVVEGSAYLAHMLAWFIVTGGRPDTQVDLVNWARVDNLQNQRKCHRDLTPTGDLDGLAQNAGIGSVPDNDTDEDEELPADIAAELTSAGAAIIEGLMITNSGVHKRTAEGARTICNIAFRKPTLRLDIDDSKMLGLEATLMCDGDPVGRHSVPGRAFTSRANLSAYCSSYGGIFSGTDTQAGAVMLMLNRSAKKGKRVVYALHKEGLDLVQNPLVKHRSERDVVWVHPDCLHAKTELRFQIELVKVVDGSVAISRAVRKNIRLSNPLPNTAPVNTPKADVFNLKEHRHARAS